MKRNNNHHLRRNALSLLLAVVTLGCSDEMRDFYPDDGAEGLKLEFQASIDQVNTSRADESGFADGDRFGVFVVNYKGNTPSPLTLDDNQVNNVAMTYDIDTYTWHAATDLYWRDNITPADIYGYYPFVNGLNSVDAYSFEVSSDQGENDGDMGAYEASDFLWARTTKATPGKKVELTFYHVMAGVKVNLIQGSGFDGDAWDLLDKTVTVDNTLRSCKIDLSTGTVIPSGVSDRNIKMCLEAPDVYRAVVVPQTVGSGKSTIGITIDGNSYAYYRDGGMTFVPGKLHNFTIKIDKRESGDYEISLVSQEISPWENDRLSHNFFEYGYTSVTVTDPGTLKETIIAMNKDYTKIKNLKITGPIDTDDFTFMREEMSELAMLNMKEAKSVAHWTSIEEVTPGNWGEVRYDADNGIPPRAFYGKETLRRIIFPDEIEYIGSEAFREIGLDVNSSLVLPKNLKYIADNAFFWIGEAGELVLNDKLEYVGNYAFGATSFRCELNLPPTLKHIGSYAFGYGGNNSYHFTVTGSFRLPDNLEFIGQNPFDNMTFDGVGEVIVPSCMTELENIFPNFKNGMTITFHDDIKKINEYGLSSKRFVNRVVLPPKLTRIEPYAFELAQFGAGLTLPASLRDLGGRCFRDARGLGDIVIPDGVEVIPGECFAGTDLNSVVLPNSVLSIENGAFSCDIKSATIGKYCGFIGALAFSAPQLQSLICLNPEPPLLDGLNNGEDPFRDCNMDHLILQVPEESVDLYRNTEGWNRIRFITAYHEMAVGVSEIQCLDKGMEYHTLLRSEGEWEVSSCPDWVTVEPSSGSLRRNEISIKVAATSIGSHREGTVTFKLKGKDYTTTVDVRQLAFAKGEDKELPLCKATAPGTEIPLLFVGEGFTAADIADGSYMRAMEEAYSAFFAIEPYNTYQTYFTASTAIAVSPDGGMVGNTMETNKFGFAIDEGISMDWNRVRAYARSVDSKFNSSRAMIVVVPNYNSFIGMVDHSDQEADVALCGYSLDTYPYDFRGTVQHYAGGVAFGKLAPEYVHHYEFIRGCTCPACNSMDEYRVGVTKGWYGNVSLSGAINALPWQHYMFHPQYSDIVDIFEGGMRHLRGVYRSENQSCMSTYIDYYNTISRELIVRRIMSLSGNNFDLNDFIARDSREGCPM